MQVEFTKLFLILKNPVWNLRKLNTELSCDPAMSLLSTYPKELKTGTKTDTCMQMLIAALFTIAKRGKQFNWPWRGKCIHPLSRLIQPQKGMKL